MSGVARAQSTPEQTWLNDSCPRYLGPTLWKDCVERETRALQSPWPDLSSLSLQFRQWINDSCPRYLGPSLALDCVQRQFSALRAPGWPDLSVLQSDQRKWLQDSCPRYWDRVSGEIVLRGKCPRCGRQLRLRKKAWLLPQPHCRKTHIQGLLWSNRRKLHRQQKNGHRHLARFVPMIRTV